MTLASRQDGADQRGCSGTFFCRLCKQQLFFASVPLSSANIWPAGSQLASRSLPRDVHVGVCSVTVKRGTFLEDDQDGFIGWAFSRLQEKILKLSF